MNNRCCYSEKIFTEEIYGRFWVEIVALAVLIGLSGFFSGLEVALVGVRKSKVNQLLKKGKKGAKALHKLKTNPGWMMSSVNLGNNLVNVGASALATSIAIRIVWR